MPAGVVVKILAYHHCSEQLRVPISSRNTLYMRHLYAGLGFGGFLRVLWLLPISFSHQSVKSSRDGSTFLLNKATNLCENVSFETKLSVLVRESGFDDLYLDAKVMYIYICIHSHIFKVYQY